ncbi:MAG: hypothetical protein KJ645_02525, partial [Planctomycetes bacterium]|nr:hypothetical protein [Planctomycetota bacterium]
MPQRDLILILLLALATFICYSNALFGEFLYDDQPYITKNPQVNGEQSLENLFKQSTPPDKPHLG